MIPLTDLDALLITNPTNIRYITGFVGAAPEEREAYCLLAQESIFLFTNALYLEKSKNLKSQIQMTKRNTIEIIEISREEPFAKKLKEILLSVIPAYAGIQRNNKLDPRVKPEDDNIVRLGFEETYLTVAEYKKLEKELNGITLVPTQGRIEELRMMKREDEIKNIKAATNLTDQCFEFILHKLKANLTARTLPYRQTGSTKTGVTETEIAWEIEAFIRTRGAELSFSPIVAFGTNTSQPHYIPQPQGPALSVETPNIVLLDFGAKVNGYCSDMTRMIFIGKPKREWVKAYDTVLQAQTAALKHLVASRPGLEARGSEADRIAREVIKKSGFPVYPHSLGHGVGLDIHEAPRLTVNPSTNSRQSLKSGPSDKLVAGMIVTIEPAIYIEGSYGIRIEDLVLLKKDGVEVLSRSNKKMIIL